jgi:hypothetical protein
MNAKKRAREIDEAVSRLNAIISYRETLISSGYEERDSVLRKEIAVINRQREALRNDYESAPKTIAELRKRITEMQTQRALITLKTGGRRSPFCYLNETEKKKLMLRRALAVMKELQEELEGEGEDE